MHILEELYVGSIRPGERTFKQNSQQSRTIKELTKCEEKLDATLSKEQKSLLNDYRDAQQDLMVITDCETFIRGFQIGAKIMLDVLTEGEVKELQPSPDGSLYTKKRPGIILEEQSELLRNFLTTIPSWCILLIRTGAEHSERETWLQECIIASKKMIDHDIQMFVHQRNGTAGTTVPFLWF